MDEIEINNLIDQAKSGDKKAIGALIAAVEPTIEVIANEWDPEFKSAEGDIYREKDKSIGYQVMRDELLDWLTNIPQTYDSLQGSLTEQLYQRANELKKEFMEDPRRQSPISLDEMVPVGWKGDEEVRRIDQLQSHNESPLDKLIREEEERKG